METMSRKSIFNRFTPAVIIPVILLVVLVNIASFTVLYQNGRRAAKTAAELNHLYVAETDKNLRLIQEYLFLLQRNESSFDMIRSEDEWTRMHAKLELQKSLETTISGFSLLDYLFTYDLQSGELLYAYGLGSTQQTRKSIRTYLESELFTGNPVPGYWEVVSVGGESYLLTLLESKKVYLGALVRMADFEEPLRRLSSESSFLSVVSDDKMMPASHRAFIEENGIQLKASSDFYLTGTQNHYYVRTDRSDEAPYYLCLVLPRTFLTGPGGFFLITLLLVSVSAVALIPLLTRLIRKDVVEPLKVLDTAIGEINSGDALYQIPLRDDPEEETIKGLMSVCGVGVKVANCISLFGLHHIDAFPIDVWIRRILDNEYPSGYPKERYSPYNGIYQQYMFYYYRNLITGISARPERENVCEQERCKAAVSGKDVKRF